LVPPLVNLDPATDGTVRRRILGTAEHPLLDLGGGRKLLYDEVANSISQFRAGQVLVEVVVADV
jgi:hypothetical protein